MCSHFLVAARRVAKQNGTPTDRGCDVLTSGKYHLVQDAEGKTVWEGDAHCKFCARTEAIGELANQVPA